MLLPLRWLNPLCAAIGIFLVVFSLALSHSTIEIHLTWVRTEGVVLAVPTAMAELLRTLDAPSTAYQDVAGLEIPRPTAIDGLERPLIEFTDRSGAVRRTTSVEGTELPSLHSVGDVVPLYYAPDDPSKICVASSGDEWATQVVSFGAGLLLLGIPRLSRMRLPSVAQNDHVLRRSLTLQVMGFAIAVAGPPIAGISPGRVPLVASIPVACVSIAGVALLLAAQQGHPKRSPLVDALPVSLSAVVLELVMVRRVIVAESAYGLTAAGLLFAIGSWPVLKARPFGWRQALGTCLVGLSVLGTSVFTLEVLHSARDVPPFLLMASVVGLAAGNFMCRRRRPQLPSGLGDSRR